MSVRRYNEYEDDELESVGIYVEPEDRTFDEWLDDEEVGYYGER